MSLRDVLLGFRGFRAVPLTLLWLLSVRPAGARAETARFAVVNLTPDELPAPVVDEAEREYARLRPGVEPLADAAMRRLLATGETAARALPRLVEQARALRAQDACAEAVPVAHQAEELALSSVPVDDSREALKRLYVVLVACEAQLGRDEPRDQAARRLRALVSSAPADLPPDLWEAHVAMAVPGPGAVELQVDSEPANAHVILNFHHQGTTPRTVKLPPGEVLVEVQKEGYKKAFRRLELRERPERTVFRLADLRLDRTELAAAALQALEREESLEDRQRTLAQLAQWARVDSLVLLRGEGPRVIIRFFDAERGAVARESVISPYDPDTGRIEVLARRQSPGGRSAGGRPGILAPVSPDGHANRGSALPPESPGPPALKQTFEGPPPLRSRPDRGSGPWWGWLIAAAVAGGIAAVVLTDQTRRADTIDVTAGF